jgi:hypothetical protein
MALSDIVASARDRHLGRGQVGKWLRANGVPKRQATRVAAVAKDLATAVVEAARQGDYFWARKHSEPDHATGIVYELFGETVQPMERCLDWQAFAEACKLAERLDSFLVAVARDKVAAALAADCRQDLRMLLVLADWCAEHDLPATAVEARYLYRLTR